MRRLLELTPDELVNELLPDRQFLRHSGEPFFPESKAEATGTAPASMDNAALSSRGYCRRTSPTPRRHCPLTGTAPASMDNAALGSVMYVGSIHVNSAPEHQAVNKLERLEKTTAIGSHSSTIINAI